MAIQDLLFPPEKPEGNDTSALEHGNHGVDVLDIVRIQPGVLTPHSANRETFENVVLDPVVIKPETCSLGDADAAEDLAERTKTDVANAIRRLKAAATMRQQEAKLQAGFRAYQVVEANTALLKAKSNGKLARHLLNQRDSWAELGYGTQREIGRTDQQVSNTRYRYLGA